jgi:S-adenosylmethionine-diacylglycerol 3-amino-3-carboxypropyl transferase
VTQPGRPEDIVFTRAWEDDRLDLELLSIAPGQRALVVAGAGDTALALASGGGHVVAVDRNVAQLRLCALKHAAARSLPAGRLHTWFEAGRGPGIRGEYATAVRPLLDRDDAAWWDARIGLFKRGLHRSVGLGRRFLLLGRIARLLRPSMARRVETFVDPAEQHEWWGRSVRPWLFGRGGHWLIGHGPLLPLLSPNRNETARVRETTWSRGLADRVDAVVARQLVRHHPWWRPLASGRAADPEFGSAWIDAARAAALRDGGAQVQWIPGDLVEAIVAQPPGSIDALSVSNVPDWLDEGDEARLAEAIARAAAPGARVLVRHLVRPVGPDPYVAAGLTLDPRSERLPGLDRTALYEAVDLYRMGVQVPKRT